MLDETTVLNLWIYSISNIFCNYLLECVRLKWVFHLKRMMRLLSQMKKKDVKWISLLDMLHFQSYFNMFTNTVIAYYPGVNRQWFYRWKRHERKYKDVLHRFCVLFLYCILFYLLGFFKMWYHIHLHFLMSLWFRGHSKDPLSTALQWILLKKSVISVICLLPV